MPETAARAILHRGSFWDGAASSLFGGGREASSSGKTGDGGSFPPQEDMMSSGVTASGSRALAMRFADVV